MLKRTAAAVLFLLAVPWVAVTAPSDPSEPAPIEVGVCVGPTTFYASNFSAQVQVLFFKSGSAMVWRALQPGEVFKSTYAREALNDVYLELANYDNGVWHTSGAVSLARLCDSGGDALWIQDGSTLASWLQIESSLTPFATDPSFLPATFPTTSESSPGTADLLMAPAHVPVVTPTERPQGDLPQTLGDGPLPPF